MSATRRHGGTLRPIRDLARARADARIGMVFQHFNLFDHLTAVENIIEAPIQVYGEDPKKARELGAAACWRASASAAMPTICRIGFPAASSSVSRSPARSRSRRA